MRVFGGFFESEQGGDMRSTWLYIGLCCCGLLGLGALMQGCGQETAQASGGI